MVVGQSCHLRFLDLLSRLDALVDGMPPGLSRTELVVLTGVLGQVLTLVRGVDLRGFRRPTLGEVPVPLADRPKYRRLCPKTVRVAMHDGPGGSTLKSRDGQLLAGWTVWVARDFPLSLSHWLAVRRAAIG